MRIVTWNLRGGQTTASDSDPLDYFADQLRVLNPDVICLQEVHSEGANSDAATIGEKLGNYTCFHIAMNPSTIAEGKELGLAILTRDAHEWPTLREFPPLPVQPTTASGAPMPQERIGVQQINYANVVVGNVQLPRLVDLRQSYQDADNVGWVRTISETLASLPSPLILCGDFGIDAGPGETFATMFQDRHLQSALPAEAATYSRETLHSADLNAPDAIYYFTDALQIKDSGIVQTMTDHYLCWADVEPAEPPETIEPAQVQPEVTGPAEQSEPETTEQPE